MPAELIAEYLRLPVFALVAGRLGGLIMFQPLLGALSVPGNIRVLLVLGLAAVVTPVVPLPDPMPGTLGGLALAIGLELLLGVLMGGAVAICFLGLQMAGLLIAQESGLAFGRIADPSSGEQLAVISSFYLQLGAVVFLIIGGHRVLVRACLESFIAVPLLSDSRVTEVGAPLLIDTLAVGFEMAVRIAAPTVLALFLVNVALGFISRTVPQLNITTIGFSLKGLLAFVLVAIALPMSFDAFRECLETVMHWVGALVAGWGA